ncbi:MAG: NAD(P)-dependent oxidoreductase, partial [Bdellovibrionales bacterium]|nr:NAD(P)-dependent oxidoreductase [Bdellovibrionales bacterium]
VYAGTTPLSPVDVAEAVLWCLHRPPHVNVQEILLMPTDQASPRDVHRRAP